MSRKFRVSKGALRDVEGLEDALFLDFFNSGIVQTALKEEADRCEGACGSPSDACPYHAVQWEAIRCSVINTKYFDRLKDEHVRILAPTGAIKPSLDEQFDGATSWNRLTDMFLNEYSENAHCFDEEESKELILKILKMVCVGGALCQPEENIEKYLTILKLLYKEMVSVEREESSGKIQVTSRAYAINGLDAGHRGLFAKDNSNNACYITVDANTRTLCYLSFSFLPYW